MHPFTSADVLPAVPDLLARCRALAALGALAAGDQDGPAVYTLRPSPEGGPHRYGRAARPEGPVFSLAADGASFEILFGRAGTLLWGYVEGAARLPLPPPPDGARPDRLRKDGIRDQDGPKWLPAELRPLLPAAPVGVLIWRGAADDAWHVLDAFGALSGDGALLHDLVAVRPRPPVWLRSRWPVEAVWDVLDLPCPPAEPTPPAPTPADPAQAAPERRVGGRRGGSTPRTAPAPSAAPEEVFRCQDASGLITTAVFRRRTEDARSHVLDLPVAVPDDMVVVGGGAVAEDGPVGALLTASYPAHDLTEWRVSSKDHVVPQAHRLTGYAIGLRIEGVSRRRLAEELLLVRRVGSAQAAHPEAAAPVPPGHVLLGGGFRVGWHDGPHALGAGNLATASYPVEGTEWRVRAKDHLVSHPSTVDAYAVCLRDSFTVDGVPYRVQGLVRTEGSEAPVERPAATVSLHGTGHALTGIGADVRPREPGSLLWRLAPVAEDGGPGAAAGGKDHLEWAPTTLGVYALGVRLLAEDPKLSSA
ncbi:hypothetical protein [Streptomyces sp. NPDC047097]|uniref:hypothetical protein n=1 Tax=Streptomyces sp. NPDC047097 TaxID=3155260 RepID=UPI003402F469